MAIPSRHSQTFDFCQVEVFDDYIYVQMNEGIVVKREYNDFLLEYADIFFKGKTFAYISHRKNSYTVDPLIYIETSKVDQLKGIVVVNEIQMDPSIIAFEMKFLTKPSKVVQTLEDAYAIKDQFLDLK